MAELLSEQNFKKLSEYIYRKSGIYLDFEKHYTKLSNYCAKRFKELKTEDFRKYFFKLRFEDKEGEEFQQLMNAMTVNETYFFRENNQFETLVNSLLPKLHAMRPKGKPLRILSAPSSTGEEPYSMVIHILEEGKIIEERDIEIVAMDIDSSVITKAREGKYTDRSIHAIPKPLAAKYFTKNGSLNEFDPELRNVVDFRVLNIFDKEAMHELGKFDVIFSRNMLIYFDDASRKEVAMTFYEMLEPGGSLLLGHAEYMSRIVSVFKVKKENETLIYQK